MDQRVSIYNREAPLYSIPHFVTKLRAINYVFRTGEGSSDSSDLELRVPFDLPLTGYRKQGIVMKGILPHIGDRELMLVIYLIPPDKPWVWNIRYMDPDSQNNVWTPS